MKTLLKNLKTLPTLLGDTENQKESFQDMIDINILINGDVIEKIFHGNFSGDDLDKADLIIDGQGHFLSPGLCDPQVHFREPGLEYKEDIESGSRAANKGGFTTVISMPNTSPFADNEKVISFMVNKSKEVGLCDVHPTGAVTISLAGKELPDFIKMKQAGAIAFTDDGKGVQNDEIFYQAMVEAEKLDMPILDHSEDESLSLKGAIHKGDVSKKYGVPGIDSRSESVHVKRGCDMSEKTGCHYHVLHISTRESINHVKAAKAKGVRVTAEVSPHHLFLCDDDIPERETGKLDPNWKMNPPLRSSDDRAACVEALLDGTIDAIATDHAPHAPYEKEAPIEKAPFGIIGLETAFPLVFTNLVKNNKLALSQCVDLMSKNAGALFKLDMGRIKVGTRADLAIFDLENEFEITKDFFASKSKNSPFIKNKLFGKTLCTLFKGKVVYKEESL